MFYPVNMNIIFALMVTIVSKVFCDELPPHIILVVGDDVGWNDVGFHGSSDIQTPNIDALAYSGVILNNYYVHPLCTPSRGALLTGYHPIHTGLQYDVIFGYEPFGLPLHFDLLPKYLSDLGYVSKAVGKWHLGNHKKEYTPTYRGFESHYGYWTSRIDYYSHQMSMGCYAGYDFRNNMEVDREAFGKYTTDLFTEESVRLINEHNSSQPLFLYLAHHAVHSANDMDPLQAPAEILDKFSYIKDENRRKFAAMMWKLDESLGQVVKSLDENGMLSNSLVVFTTDNGGPADGFNNNAASNWPLRGIKGTLWDGGIRGSSFVWSPLIKNPGRVSTGMMQVMDWVPTLYRAAGGDVRNLPQMDGMDMWFSIVKDSPSPRTEMLHNIDPILRGAALRVGDWKLVFNASTSIGEWNYWYGPTGRIDNGTSIMKFQRVEESITGQVILKMMPDVFNNYLQLTNEAEVLCGPVPAYSEQSCGDKGRTCLYHIPSDPCEYFDVSEENHEKVEMLKEILKSYNATAVPPGNKPDDPKSNPVFWDYTWTTWQDEMI